MTSELVARRHGEALLEQMKGTGWKLEVWENLGWHYCVVNGTLYIYAHEYMDGISYTSLMGDGKHPHAGLPVWTDDYHSKDPNKVVEHQLAFAQKYMDHINAAFSKVMANIHPKKGV